MLDRFTQYLQEKGLAREGDRVLCMVSGGADSVAMLHLFSRLAQDPPAHFPHSLSLGICHVNYGRRGEASDADELLVRRLGDELRAPVHVIHAPRGERSNFQAWARDFRYLAAQNLCRWQGYTRIAVAHNRDDRVETFLYRLITYSGRRSLVVMPSRRGRVIRPLLFATADEIRSFCADSGLHYHDDESNSTLDYARNQVRHLVMPRLAEIRPGFQEHVIDTLSLLEDEDEALDIITADAWQSVALTDGGPGATELDGAALAGLPRGVARLVIRRWLSEAGRKIRPSRRLLDSILDLVAERHGTSFISLPAGLQVERRYDRLRLVDVAGESAAWYPRIEDVKTATAAASTDLQEHGAAAKNQDAGASLAVPGRAVFGDYVIEAVESPGWEVASGDPMQATFDADRLEAPLEVRSWRPGDRFAPLGLGGSKSIQDLFTDEKVPRSERGRIPIITSAGRIAWVCGLRVAEEFKVTGNTERTVGLKAVRRAVERAV